MARARGAAVGPGDESLPGPETVLAENIQINDMIWFDQASTPSEVLSVSDEIHGEVSVRRIVGLNSAWTVRSDQEIRREHR